jgi:hypothetical protein
MAASQASDSSSRPSIRLHANLKARNRAEPFSENNKSGLGSFRTQLCSDISTQKLKRFAFKDLRTLSKTQLRFKEIHQQITKLKKRCRHAAKDTADFDSGLGNGGLPNLEQLPQSFSDLANKTPEAGCSPVYRHAADDREASQAAPLAVASSENDPPVESSGLTRPRSFSGHTGLTEAEVSDSIAGSIVNFLPACKKRGLSQTHHKLASSLALQQEVIKASQLLQTAPFSVQHGNPASMLHSSPYSPLRKPRVPKLDTAGTWNNLAERHSPVTQRAFKHRRAKKLNLLMNIDLSKLKSELDGSQQERKLDAAKTLEAGLKSLPSGGKSARQEAPANPAFGNSSTSRLFEENKSKTSHSSENQFDISETALRLQTGQKAVHFATAQTGSSRALLKKPEEVSPSYRFTPNKSASRRPEKKRTPNQIEIPKQQGKPCMDFSPGRTKQEPQTPNPIDCTTVANSSAIQMPDEKTLNKTEAADTSPKKAWPRKSDFISDFETPTSRTDFKPNATEIDQKSLYNSFSLMYRTIFSKNKLASTAYGLKKKQIPRPNFPGHADRPGTTQETPERLAHDSESSAETTSSREASRYRSTHSHHSKVSSKLQTPREAASTSRPQILVLQPSRKPTPALAVILKDFSSRDRIPQQFEVDLCESSSESSSFRKLKRSSSRSSFSGFYGSYGRHKAQ